MTSILRVSLVLKVILHHLMAGNNSHNHNSHTHNLHHGTYKGAEAADASELTVEPRAFQEGSYVKVDIWA